MKKFEFSTAQKIIFGSGSIKQIEKYAGSFGRTCLLVSSKSAPFAKIEETLKASGIQYEIIFVKGEPTLNGLQKNLAPLRALKLDLIIGIGGGSVLDFAKAISALLTNQGDLLDYLEVVGKNQPIINSPVPLIAIPTTAGTGTEVTRNAVIKIEDKGVKVSLRSEKMIPKIAIVDPELTLSLPRDVTASTGMDALVQLIEPYISSRSNPMIDMVCKEGISLAAQSLETVYSQPDHLPSREKMAFSSLLGGMALANAGLGVVHGFAAVLGGKYPVAHGQCCARILPAAYRINYQALKSRDSQSEKIARFLEIARMVTNHNDAQIEDGITWFQELCRKLNIPHLKQFGISSKDSREIIENVKRASSTKGNPIQLNDDELLQILEESM